jgi:hypothetical protein
MFKTLIALAVAATLCVFAAPVMAHAAPMAPVSFSDIVADGPVQLTAPAPSTYATPTAFVPDGEVPIAWGALVDALIGDLLDTLPMVLAGFVAWVLRKLPEEVAGIFRAWRVDQLLDKALQYGINATRGAVKDRALTVQVGNEVLERAFEYALRHAPMLVSKIGASEYLREKIIARLNLEADAAVPTPRPAAEFLVSADALTVS